ncbi:MAG: polymer-forming cytoskeletal protein [Polaromonas sp.]|nr:polymer-forming cytoskeletal protein [Polaromonas sp.]
MFGKRKQPPIKSLIAPGTTIEGTLTFGDGIRIDGIVIGDIRAMDGKPSMLFISESATITGAVYADHVIVNGCVKGPIHAGDLLELQPKAKIEGDVFYKALEMHQGAAIFGQLRPASYVEPEGKPALKLAAIKLQGVETPSVADKLAAG